MADRITDEERAAIERALSTRGGQPGRKPKAEPKRRRRPYPDRLYLPETMGAVPRAPANVPRDVGVADLLSWAFGTEKAALEFDEVGASAGSQRLGVGMEYILEQRFMLGGVSIDTSPGRSYPADDAEIVASIVGAYLPRRDAILVAEHARAGTSPNCMEDAAPKLEPLDWHCNRHGWSGRTADARELGGEGWRPQRRRNRKGVVVTDEVRYTPCRWNPTASQIAAARRRYLEWWGHLLTIRAALRNVELRRFRLTDAMPPLTPWRGFS